MTLRRVAVLIAMGFPSLMAWLYFVVLAGEGGQANPWLQGAYSGGKFLQLLLPVGAFWLAEGHLPAWPRPTLRGLTAGLIYGVLVGGAIVLLYQLHFRYASSFLNTPALVRRKVEEFGLATPVGFILLGTFISAVHSLLEEYYWRWFVFGELKRWIGKPSAILISSLAFMAHHIIVLHVYFPEHFLFATLPFSLSVAAGGVFWAWLYDWSGSIYAPWISHLLVDAGIMVVGYQMLFG